jgi:hypothetical protein
MQLLLIIERAGSRREFVISHGGFTDDVLTILDAQAVGARLKARESDCIEIPVDRLLELKITSHVSVIDGMVFDNFDDEVDALAKAQRAATAEGTRLYLASSFHPPVQA